MTKAKGNPIFVSFRMNGDDCVAAVPLREIQSGRILDENKLKEVANIYAKSIHDMKIILENLETTKSKKIPMLAVDIWDLGDKIVSLIETINKKGFTIDGVYDHLIRDLGRKKQWLKKIIIFRKNLPDRNMIPNDLKWSVCKDAPRYSAKLILKGESLELLRKK